MASRSVQEWLKAQRFLLGECAAVLLCAAVLGATTPGPVSAADAPRPAPAPNPASAAESDLRILQPSSMETPAGSTNGVVYLTIHNIGAHADRLVGASTPLAAQVEIHGTSMAGGVMQMRPLAGVDIASGGDAEFVSGGMHLMLVGLKRPLKKGESFPLTLKFRRAGDRTVSVSVASIGARHPARP
jgi:copper(I)-binding protein